MTDTSMANGAFLTAERRRPSVAVVSATGALGVALCLFIASVLVLSVNLNRVQDGFAEVERANAMRLEIAAVETSLADGAAALRSYLLTGAPRYLDALDAAESAARGALDALARMAAHEPLATERVDDLRPVADARLASLERLARLGRDGIEQAVPAMTDDDAERSAVRDKLARFKEAELARLAERQREVRKGAVLSTVSAAAFGILALLSAALGLFLLQRERARFRLRELEAELIHVSRLNMVGQTASMLAHEINQPLAATSNYLQGVRRMLETGDPSLPPTRLIEAVQKATAQVERASEIVRRLRSYVRKREPEQAAADVAATLGEAVALLGVRSDGLVLHRRIAPDLPPVLIDKVQVQQVVVNLMRNAVEAMEGCARRELTLAASPAGMDMVQISVADTGPGLPREVAERLFQPFVTTKGSGMGVGLSICRTIVEAQGGRIWAEPNPGGGTIFHFTVAVMRRCISCERRGPACAGMECPAL